jgi:hypothetical protein
MLCSMFKFFFQVWGFVTFIIYIVLFCTSQEEAPLVFLSGLGFCCFYNLHSFILYFREEAPCYTTLLLSSLSTFGICNVKFIVTCEFSCCITL